MPVLELDEVARLDTANLVKIEFHPEASAPLGQRADLYAATEGELAPVLQKAVTSIPVLQQLRAAIGDGSGTTAWVRVRDSGGTGDNWDSYVNLQKVADAVESEAADGPIARLRSAGGVELGEVHLPAALQKVRELKGRRS